MRGPGRPLLLGLLLVLGAAGAGVAEPREAADRQTLLRLIVEILQELKKYHSGESKRLQLSGQHYTLGRREVSDYPVYPEEQRVEIVPRDLRMKDKFLKHLTGKCPHSFTCAQFWHPASPHNLLLPCSRSSLFQSKVQQALSQTLPQHQRLHHPCM
ncbi:ALK and LTK ligand 2 isoform X1 [Ursus americanus]|uniref:ALK and LTK ligand 2 isoform X1 n=1 Tax=Ursus americanus TaxID=9643 RepID=UPI001E67AC5E|nr:ALK and LTK ligand 2 isoform X1 [Ursus americanus]